MPGPPPTTERAPSEAGGAPVQADAETPAPDRDGAVSGRRTASGRPRGGPVSGDAQVQRGLVIAGVVVAVGLVVLALGRLAGERWFPIGDFAQAELRMFSFWRHPPLVGAAGRIADLDGRQGNHPGPLMFWMLWPGWKLFGGSNWAFNVSCGVTNLLGGGLAVVLAHRTGGRRAAAAIAATFALLVAAFGPEVVLEPWNPSLPLLWFLAFLVAVWGVLCGRRLQLLAAVFAGSYCVQSHAGYLPMVAVLGGAAALATLLVGRNERVEQARAAAPAPPEHPSARSRVAALCDRLASHPWLVLGAGAVLGLILWSPVLYQAATGDRSNLVILWHSFGNPDAPYVGLSRSFRLVFLQFDPVSTLVRSQQVITGFPVVGLVVAAAWVGLAAASWHRSPLALRRLHLLLAATTVLAVASVARIFGTVLLYLFEWSWVITALVLVASGWSATVLLRTRTRVSADVRRLVPAVAIGLVLIVAAVGGATRYGTAGIASPRYSRTVQAIMPRLTPHLDRDRRYLVEWDDPVALGGIGFGVLLDLERNGFDVGALPNFSAAAEPHRVRTEAQADAVLHIATGPADIARWRATPGARELAAVDIRTPAEVARARRAHDRLLAGLRRIGRTGDLQQADKGPLFPLFLDESLPQDLRDLVAEQIEYFPGTAVFETVPAGR